MRRVWLSGLQLLLMALWSSPLLSGQTANPVFTVNVPATANPYLAGMPRGTKARVGDSAPEESPVLVQVSLDHAISVTFAASGAVEHGPFNPPQFDPPAGSMATRHQGGPEHGIADLTAPIDSLLGVFLDDNRPDRTRAPKPLKRGASPELKQVFFIGARRKVAVPKGATRLFLGVMDSFEWNNNHGAFSVIVTIERTDVSSNMFSVDSRITFAEWACLPDRSQCTPDHAVVQEQGPGQYHIILPAQSEWGASIPAQPSATVTVHGATGTVCLDAQSRSTSSCNGPQGNGSQAGAGYLAPDRAVGALVSKTTGDRTYFSVNDRSGDAFQKHEGYFEFDVTTK
jgi:hypothetical protein